MLVLLPLFVYLLIVCMWLYVHYTLPMATWVSILCCFICCGGLIAMGFYGEEMGWQFVLGVSCGVACLLAIWIGSVGYQWYMREYWWQTMGRHYTDLNATTVAQSRNDASWLHFGNGSHVDTMKAVGYRDSAVTLPTIFCVAPVLSARSLARVQYWAIGKDCCEKRSGFSCGDAAVPGAQSAIAVLGEDFVDQISFRRAIRQAEAAHKLASAEGALLLRWVSDPRTIRRSLLWSALSFLAIGAALELIIASILACVMPRYGKTQQSQYGFGTKSKHGTKNPYGTKDPFATHTQRGYY